VGSWIEIRPLRTARSFSPDSIKRILKILYNSKKPFRFVAASFPDQELMNKNIIKFYFEFPDEDTKRYFANLLATSLDIEVFEAKPPKLRFERCAELELARHFAHPIFRPDAQNEMPMIDNICNALVNGGAFEIVAVGDIGAKTAVHQFVYDRMHGKPSFAKSIADTAFDVYQEAAIQRDVKDVSREAWWSYRRYKDDKWVQKEVADAEKKMHEGLFTCEVRLYGDRIQIENMKQSLPSGMNRFKIFKTIKNVVFPPRLKKPRRIIGALWFFGIFDPLRLGEIDLVILAGIAVFSAVLAFTLRKRIPIVLSETEMSLLVGLPNNPGRLPIRFGISSFSLKPSFPLRDVPVEAASEEPQEAEEEEETPLVEIERQANDVEEDLAGEEQLGELEEEEELKE